MKAALMTGVGKPLELANIERMPISYGQVFVSMSVSGICGAQIQEIDGHKASGPLPHPLGHEGCGTVKGVGEGVTTVKAGDKVVLHWRKGDGIESDFPRFQYEGREITGGKVTTFSQYTVVSENRCTSVPMDTPEELCALMGCGLSTAFGTIEMEAKVKFGETVLILGCGGLGLNLIRAARMAQSSNIVAIDIHEAKRVSAMEAGADVFTWRRDQVLSARFDAIIDTTGDINAIEAALPLLAPSGRFIMIGQPRADSGFLISNARHFFDGEGKMIKATQGGCFNPAKDIPRYIRLWKAGRLSIDNIVTHRVTLDKINDGINLVRKGLAGRVMIVCNES